MPPCSDSENIPSSESVIVSKNAPWPFDMVPIYGSAEAETEPYNAKNLIALL